jgi:intergrase/recombinase
MTSSFILALDNVVHYHKLNYKQNEKNNFYIFRYTVASGFC